MDRQSATMELPGSRTQFDLYQRNAHLNFHLIEVGCKRGGKPKQLWQRTEVLEQYWNLAVTAKMEVDFTPTIHRTAVHFLPAPMIGPESVAVDDFVYVEHVVEEDLASLDEHQQCHLRKAARGNFPGDEANEVITHYDADLAQRIISNTQDCQMAPFRGLLTEYIALNMFKSHVKRSESFVSNGWLRDVTCAISKTIRRPQTLECDGMHIYYDHKSHTQMLDEIAARPNVACYQLR